MHRHALLNSLRRYLYGMVCFASWFLALVPCTKAQPPPLITNLAGIKSLTPAHAGPGIPLRIQGTVVCYDAGWHQLYLHDGSETCYFNADDFQIQPEIGQTVVISGTALGNTIFTNMALTVLGKSPLPVARKLALSELAREHGEWIETTGRLLSMENSRGRMALLLHDKGQNALAYILGAPVTNDLKSFLDCDVLIRGINASKTNGHGGLEAPLIFISGVHQLSTHSMPQAKMSQIPVVSIGSLLNREPDYWTNTWVHVNGLVVSYEAGQSVVVKDPTGVIRARVIQLTEIHGDARVDVWGFLQSSGDETFLNSAYFEVVPPPAQDLAVTPRAGAVARERFPEVLEQFTDILKLSREEAALNLPVRLRGVITYADPEWRNGFLQDKTGAIYVDLAPSLKDLRPGQWVELQGQTSPGGFAPEVLSSAVQVLGVTNLPAPVRVDLEDLADGHLDAHWVEMDGVVRRIDELSGHISLNLTTPKGRFKAIIPGFGNQPLPANLIDAQVSVQGACTSELNARRQLSGITLHAPSLAHVKVLEPPPADAFSIETTPLAAVATFDPHRLAGRRVKVEGVVTLRMPGQGFILQDETGGIRVLARQTNQVELGDSLDVLGFPAIGEFSPYLEEGVFRKIGHGRLPAPKLTSADQILLHGSEDALLVEIKARLLQGVPRSANPQIVLQDGPIIFTAHLASPGARAEVPALQSGSLLRLTGVCAIQGGEHHEPQSFRLQLRHPDDIELLETAPWWTARHAFVLAASLMIAVAAALAWITLLRRQVRTQTELIRQKLKDEAALEQRFQELFEHANDMLYTQDIDGRITSINQAGERLLQRSRAEILSHNLLDLVASEQQPAARQWFDTVLKGTAPPTVEFDFTSASGQRVTLEISTRLIEQNGHLLEVEGSARDITERKRLEREILEISNREQRRIGHDLHDGVCQQLAGIAFMTSNLADELEERGVSESAQAEKISGLLNTVVTQTRGVARGLFPVRLEEHGLVSALEELAANASDLFKVNCRFTADNPPAEVDNGIAIHLYYIVLEAIANASKHGQARNIEIRLEPAGPRYRLSIHDDGAGFSLTEKPRSGMGIGIMRYRARVIGATLTLQSKPGSGTAVTCLFLPAPGEVSPNGAAPVETAHAGPNQM
jgi:PAS domain S-box-containing protein